MRPRVGGRFAALMMMAVAGCGGGGGEQPVGPGPIIPASIDTIPLRTLATAHGLRLGAAADLHPGYAGTDLTRFRSTLAREFSVVTPENEMKHERIHPAPATYQFAVADSLVAFADANGMKVRGHTLVWHRQLAAWLTSGTWTATETRTLLQDHITSVVSHYRGKVLEWDVVNEALNDDGTLRPGFWADRLGRDYIETAFRAARAADPDVALFYNDYNIEGLGQKSDSAYVMLQGLLAKGVPITGVGFQGHFQVGGVPSSLAANITRFAALGLKVHITELDIRVQLPSTAAQLQTQADNYRSIVQTCLSFPACDLVVVWGVSDHESWVPSTFSGWGEALLLDASYGKKPAFTSLYNLLK